MKTINQEDFTKSLAVLFKETFEGMVAPDENIFTDKESSFFSTIGKIDAAKASAEKNQTTIAAHSEHARFYIELLDNYLNKNFHVVDFNRSWNVKSVTEDEWDLLRENISKIYRKVCETFEANQEWTLDTITVAMGILAHTAYHLGAIRQIVKEN